MFALLKCLFNEGEARVAGNSSPLAPEPPAKVAERINETPEEIAALLDGMADKGLIYSSVRNGEKWYKIIQHLSSHLGSTYFLPKTVCSAKASEILMTGRAVEAEEADRIGQLSGG